MYTVFYAPSGSPMVNAIEAGLSAIGREGRHREPAEFRRGHGEPTHGVVIDGLAPKADLIKVEYEKMGQKVLVLGDSVTPEAVASGAPLRALFESAPAASAPAVDTQKSAPQKVK